MRKLAACILVLGLTSCTSGQNASDPYEVLVAGNLGAPVVGGTTGDVPEERQVDIVEGPGQPLVFGRDMIYQVTSFDDRGEKLSGGQLQIGKFNEEMDYSTYLDGIPEGSRVIIANPQGNRAEIVIIDVLFTVASGELVELPETTVKLDIGDDGGPALLEPFGPIETLSTVIAIRGDGGQVSTGDDIIAQYSLYNSETGELVDTTWTTTGPINIDLSGTFTGLATALEGTRVGSRVVALVPASQAHGTFDAIAIVDILAISQDDDAASDDAEDVGEDESSPEE